MTDAILPESTNSPAASLTSEPEKLLPCPFCKSDNLSVEVYAVQPDDHHGGYVLCGECDAHGADAISLDGWLSAPAEARAAAITAWNTRLSSPVSGADGRERLALEAIKAVTATTKDAVRGLSRIMAITRSAGVDAPYSELMATPDVALIVNSPRTEWRHLFDRPEGCTIPPEGWACSRTPGHDGPCAASPSTPIPVIAEADLRGFAPHLPRHMRQAFFDAVDAVSPVIAEAGEREGRRTWLIERLLYGVQFYVDAEAKREDVASLVDSLDESDEYDPFVAALVQMPKWVSADDAQDAVDAALSTPATLHNTAVEGARVAAFHAIYGKQADPFTRPEAYEYSSEVADAVLATLTAKTEKAE